jgi:hypothetical protein
MANDKKLGDGWVPGLIGILIIVSFLGILVFSCVYEIPEYMHQTITDILFSLLGLVSLIAGNYFVAIAKAFKKNK